MRRLDQRKQAVAKKARKVTEGYAMAINFDFACRDDCLDKIVPSDLRLIVAERDRLRLLLSECLTKFESYGADYVHASPTNLLRRIRDELIKAI